MTLRLPLFLVLACAQLAVPVYLIHREEATLSHGRLFKFKTVPVDPVDALRGRYVALNFEAAAVPQETVDRSGSLSAPAEKTERPVYATFSEDAAGYAAVQELSDRPPASGADATLRIPFHSGWNGKWAIELPFDRYYMEEHAAPRAEAAARRRRGDGKETYALVAIYHGHAAIKDLYIDGAPIETYLAAPER